jgi:hypothetical protein
MGVRGVCATLRSPPEPRVVDDALSLPVDSIWIETGPLSGADWAGAEGLPPAEPCCDGGGGDADFSGVP